MTTSEGTLRRRATPVGRVVALAALLAVGAAAGAALAGTKTTANVTIDTGLRVASGSMGSARANAADAGQYIGCWTAYTASTNVLAGGCKAKQGATAVSCTFPNVIAGPSSFAMGVHVMNPDSHLKFTWNAAGECTLLKVSNYSYNKTKVL